MAIKNDGRVHGRRCYNDGCTCPERKIAQREYQRERARKAAEQKEGLGKLRLVQAQAAEGAPSEPVQGDRPMGRVAKATWREINSIVGAVETYPGMCELALTLADQIDKGESPQTVVSAAKEIKLILADMRPPKTPRGAAGVPNGPSGAVPERSARDVFLDKLTQAL